MDICSDKAICLLLFPCRTRWSTSFSRWLSRVSGVMEVPFKSSSHCTRFVGWYKLALTMILCGRMTSTGLLQGILFHLPDVVEACRWMVLIEPAPARTTPGRHRFLAGQGPLDCNFVCIQDRQRSQRTL